MSPPRWGLCGLAGGSFGPDSSEVMPGSEVMDRLGDPFGDFCQLVGDPGFEPGQERVAGGE